MGELAVNAPMLINNSNLMVWYFQVTVVVRYTVE